MFHLNKCRWMLHLTLQQPESRNNLSENATRNRQVFVDDLEIEMYNCPVKLF